MKGKRRSFFSWDGANYNPSRETGKGYFSDDANGSHLYSGSWGPRAGLSRAAGIATSGSILFLTDFLGLGYSIKTVMVQSNGDCNGGDTPTPGWTA